MGYVTVGGAGKMLEGMLKAESIIVKLYTDNHTQDVAAVAGTYATLSTLQCSSNEKTITTGLWTYTTTIGGDVLARATSAALSWVFTTILSVTTLRGKVSSGSTTITELAGATNLHVGMMVEAAANIMSTGLVVTSIPTSNTITISGTPSTSSSNIELGFRRQIYGHIYIGATSSNIYAVALHSPYLPTKNGDHYDVSPQFDIMLGSS